MDFKLNFLTLNVGMSATLAGLPDIVKLEKVDIVFLQEVNLSEDEIRGFIPGYDVAVNMDDNNPSKPGTAILWKKNLLVTDVCSIVSCRAQVATLGQYKLLNIYAASGSGKAHERAIFFGQEIFQFLQMGPNTCWICGGDFNAVLSPIDIEK